MAQTVSLNAAPASSGQVATDPRRWWSLAATSFGVFMALLDVTIVNVALPTIGKDLNASFSDLQWVINAYTLVLAVLLVTAGRLGDIFGRKRLFMAGLGLFALGSLGCAVAGDITIGSISHINVLIGARAFQGIGGAIMLPLSLAIIAATFHGRERGVAIGIYGGIIGLATAIGPVAGGLLVQYINWQSIFFLNVPIGFIGIALCAWAARESRDPAASRAIDFYGLATLTASLLCLVLALIQGNDAGKGWTSPYILILFAIAAAAMIAFIVGELRLAHPMVDLRLFRNPSFTGAAIVAFALSCGLFALFFFLSLYLQNYLGFSALEAGLRTLPLSALVLVVAPLASVFAERLGAKLMMAVGMAVAALAVALMTRITPGDTQTSWLVLLVPFLLGGIASGVVSPQISTVAVNTVSRNQAGMASGISSICRQLGTAFGIALLGAVLTNRYDAAIQTNVAKLAAPHVPPAQQHSVQQGIITGLQNAGTFVGSTGLRTPPPQYAHNPLLPSIQSIVQAAFINATITVFWVAAALLLAGALAAALLVHQREISTNADTPAVLEL
jgi:EmrB/QacA subfamily drug resistance transporter